MNTFATQQQIDLLRSTFVFHAQSAGQQLVEKVGMKVCRSTGEAVDFLLHNHRSLFESLSASVVDKTLTDCGYAVTPLNRAILTAIVSDPKTPPQPLFPFDVCDMKLQ